MPDDENGEDAGFLVEYVDGGAHNHPDHEGYISWSPKDVLERAYKASGFMSFGHAIHAVKDGKRIARTGWNGKNMFVYLGCGSAPAEAGRDGEPISGVPCSHFTLSDDGATVRLPTLCMKTADGSILEGWLASQTDMLAEDWEIVSIDEAE